MSSTFWKPAPVSIATSLLLRDDSVRNAQDSVGAPLYAPPRRRGPSMHQRMLLPIYKHKRQILYAVEHYGVVIIVGETGSGE